MKVYLVTTAYVYEDTDEINTEVYLDVNRAIERADEIIESYKDVYDDIDEDAPVTELSRGALVKYYDRCIYGRWSEYHYSVSVEEKEVQ